ncbi:MAG: TIGR00296 family protein [Methanocellales archaeon]
MEIGEREAKILVDIARAAAAAYLKDGVKIKLPENIPPALNNKIGVFVSLKKIEGGKERNLFSMGYPLPIKPAAEAALDSAVAVAIRARINGIETLDGMDVEVSIIGSIEPFEGYDRASLPDQIKIGEDGVLIERGFHRALYLPQIAVENGWDGSDFLSECCVKAGLMPDAWLDRDTKLYKFKVKVFK